MPKEYLGDGVYVAENTDGIVLTTENGVAVQNVIYLDEHVLRSLQDYLERRRAAK